MRLMADVVQTTPRDFVLLAPAASQLPKHFERCDVDPFRHRQLLHQAQRFRGHIYLSDGAIDATELDFDGRHVQELDSSSWHILSLNSNGDVCGCVRYHPQRRPRFHDLGVRQAAIATSPRWGLLLRLAIEQELAAAKLHGVSYAEVGGWAIAPERRCTPEALRMALSTYAIAQALGGARGITTATVRRHSSAILRRIGGRPLELGGMELPSYYDARYRCEMEILRFDSRAPGRAFREAVEDLRQNIPLIPAVCRQHVAGAAPEREPLVLLGRERRGRALSAGSGLATNA